jgi:site-specific recombinase XerD
MTDLLLKPRTLGIGDLSGITALGRIENDAFLLSRSPKGYNLKTSVTIPLEAILGVGQRGLVEYIVRSLVSERPRLISLAFENKSLVALARYFLRYRSGSLQSFYAYADTISRFSAWLGNSPDQILSDVKHESGLPNPMRVQTHARLVEDYLAMLQDQELTPGRVHTCAKHIKTFYRVNGVEIKLPYALPRRVVYKDRAPKPEELQRLLDVADLREKVIITTLALGGFREGTLVRLQYRHVRHDLENGIMPIHVHVESEITKGKYHDYGTFLGEEPVEYLRAYLEARRRGNLHRDIPPETIDDDSPLIRDEMFDIARPVGEKQVRKLIHSLYFKAGLLKQSNGSRYNLCVHSLRKFFKTQLMALGVQSDYVEYMMGHSISAYHDIQSKGVEFLRSLYGNSGLHIRPRGALTTKDQLRAMARGFGLSPEEAARLLTSSEPHRAYATQEEREEHETRILCDIITEHLKKRILGDQPPLETSQVPANEVPEASEKSMLVVEE